MRLIHTISGLAVAMLLSGCSSNEPASPSEKDTVHIDTAAPVASSAAEDDHLFPELFAAIRHTDTTFRSGNFGPFAPSYEPAEDTLKIDRAELEHWKPWLLFNNDGSRAIDLFTYGYTLEEREGRRELVEEGEADMEIAAIDFVKGTRCRLFFAGPGTVDLDARWLDKNTVLLATAQLEDEVQRDIHRFRISLFKFDLLSGKSWQSVYPALLRGDVASLMLKRPESASAH
jgi:hypothetical protein